MTDLNEYTVLMDNFVRSKGWYDAGSSRPQTARNLACSLSIEAAEVLELFQWEETAPDKQALAGELADVFLYLLQLASVSGISLDRAVMDKLAFNHTRSWADKSRAEKGSCP